MVFKAKWVNSTRTRAYFAWRSMRGRCLNPKNPSWPNYGGRGISVCDRWSDYDLFVSDMGECPDGLTLERIDVDGNYEPNNCKWVTVREQLNNQRRNRLITCNGKTQTLSYWAEERGISQDALHKRLKRMPVERALTSGKLKDVWEHGTRSGYDTHKCRCDQCRSSHNKRMRNMRAKRRGLHPA